MNWRRIVVIVVLLIAAFLVLQNREPYKLALAKFTEWFRKSWLALTRGQAPE
jgi:hypothetical protein